MEREILVNFFGDTLHRFIYHVTTSSGKFSKFDAGDVILFEIKVFSRNMKEATLARCFIKVTVRPSFTRLKVIKRINEIKIENTLQRFSCISVFFKSPWWDNAKIPKVAMMIIFCHLKIGSLSRRKVDHNVQMKMHRGIQK